MQDEEKQPLPQIVMNCLEGFLNKFFVVGKKRACPPIEKGGGYPGTVATNP